MNLLRPSRINPRLSAEAQLNGAFDFNRTPLTPPGTKALIFESSADHRTWAPHGVDGWYLGPAPKHYRCYKLYGPKTRAERTAKTVQFFPHQCLVPKTSFVDAAIVAARALTKALTNPAPVASFSQFGDAHQQAIVILSKIFQSAIAKPALPIDITPQPAFLTVLPPSLRVIIHPVPTRVTIYPVPPRVPLPVHPNFIDPDYNGDDVDAVAVPRYRLWLHRQQWTLTEQDPYYIEYNTSAISQPPRFSPGAVSCFARATWHLIAIEHRRSNHANTMIDTVTGQSLEYRHLIRGPNKDVWMTSLENDLGRLAQGFGTRIPRGTNTVF